MGFKMNKKGLMNLLIFLGVVVAIYFATQKPSVTGVEGFISTGGWVGIGIGIFILFNIIVIGYTVWSGNNELKAMEAQQYGGKRRN